MDKFIDAVAVGVIAFLVLNILGLVVATLILMWVGLYQEVF